jgi:hypothetical protein
MKDKDWISSKLLKEWAERAERGTSDWFEFVESEFVRMWRDCAGLKTIAELSEKS